VKKYFHVVTSTLKVIFMRGKSLSRQTFGYSGLGDPQHLKKTIETLFIFQRPFSLEYHWKDLP